MKKIIMIVASFILVGWSAALAQSSHDEKKLTKNSPEICAYACGDFAHIDENRVTCPTIVSFCVVVDEIIVDNMQEITWYRDGIPCGNDHLFEHQNIDETTVVSMTMTDFYGNQYSDSKTLQIQPPAGPLDAWAELVQDTINGQEGYFTSLMWDNSEPRSYQGLSLFRDEIYVGGANYEEGVFVDPIPVDPLDPPTYEMKLFDGCGYPSFSQIFEVMYLSQHEDVEADGFWLTYEVGLLIDRSEDKIIHILNEDNEDLIQVPLVAAHDSIFVTSDWMSQFSSIRAGLSIESEDKDGTIVSYSNWVDSPSYDGLSENVSAVVVYPNPTTGIVNVQVHEAMETIAIFDCLGRMLQVVPALGDSVMQININPFGKGVFYLRIQTESTVEVQKIIVH